MSLNKETKPIVQKQKLEPYIIDTTYLITVTLNINRIFFKTNLYIFEANRKKLYSFSLFIWLVSFVI